MARQRTAPAVHTWTGERVRALRKRLKLNQTEMAVLLGYTRYQTVSNIELEIQAITPTLARLLDAMEREAGLADEVPSS